MNLLLVLPYTVSDADQALRLLGWIEELGGCRKNRALLVADCKVPRQTRQKIEQKAQQVLAGFKSIATPNSLPDEKWPIGPNWMFETTLRYFQKNNSGPFLWLEPDCVPMRASWLTDLETAYRNCGKPFMGQVIVTNKPGLPTHMLSGVAVYPGNAHHICLKHVSDHKGPAWDVRMAKDVLPYTAKTPLIHNIWGAQRELAPTFVTKLEAGQALNSMPLKAIPPVTALFHRCKDESLIELLRGTGGPSVLQICMAFKAKANIRQGPGVAMPSVVIPTQRLIHCVERHRQRNAGDEARVGVAFESWERLYKRGEMTPCHVWEDWYPRHAGQMGDTRALPYLKDVLVEGMTKAGPEDIVLLTNDDTVLHPQTAKAVRTLLSKVPCCGSFRVNFSKIEADHFTQAPAALAGLGKPDLGRDLFAFRKSWLVKNWHSIPDFFLGELEWDLVMATMVRREAALATTRLNRDQLQPSCELERGLVLHQFHVREWVGEKHKTSPAKLHNTRLATGWYAENGMPSLISNF